MILSRRILAASLLFFTLSAYAIDKKLMDGSDKIEPTPAATEFISKYTHAINAKSTSEYVALLEPASRACYMNSKHPEYYRTEISQWFEFTVQSLSELRKIKPSYDLSFYKMMNYPKAPTHVVILRGEAKMKSGVGAGFLSAEMIEEDGRFYLAYRCM